MPPPSAVAQTRAKAKTGWSEEAEASHLGLPDDSFDYDDFVKREFGGRQARPRGISWIWWVTALVLLAVGLAFWLGR